MQIYHITCGGYYICLLGFWPLRAIMLLTRGGLATIREQLSAAINLDLDLLNFAFVRLFVYLCVGITSSIYELESDSSAYIPLPRCLRYLVSWQKIHGKNNTSCLYFLVEVFIKVIKVSVASLEESSALSWVYQAVNSTNYSSYRVELDWQPSWQCLS